MNGKIRVSIVATSLKGSSIFPESRPVFNVVNGSNDKQTHLSDHLFSKNNFEQNVVNSIDGATALKLDESYAIKNNDEQNALIERYENEEERQLSDNVSLSSHKDEIPTGVSIESASYIENNKESKTDDYTQDEILSGNSEEEYTPKLFSEDQNHEDEISKIKNERNETDRLFDQDTNEDEDFEIPAFLRRQKF